MSLQPDETSPGSDQADELIRAAIGQWQNHLLQLDRRNNLLYFKGRQSVRLEVEDIDQFLVKWADSRRGLKFQYAERRTRTRAAQGEGDDQDVYVVPGDIVADCPPLDLQRRLRTLRRKDKEWEEEQGLNVLYLAVGFLHWIDADGLEAASPLLLVPCDLGKASPRDPFVLLRDQDEDDIVNNLTLVHQLSKIGISLPEASPDQPPSDYLSAVTQLIKNRPDWHVESDVHLSTFQYSKMAMWEDLEQLRTSGVEHELVRALCGEAPSNKVDGSLSAAPFDLPDEKLVGGMLDDALAEDRPLLVLPADFSQIQAIEAARRGQHLLIHGPPGTGKSQTIANIAGALLADGKRVLFVSEKTAALDVVKRRLDQCGLGVFCLDLHSERGRKGNVYAQLRSSIDVERPALTDDFDYRTLEARRKQLNAYVRSLHERREPLGISVFQAQGRVARLREVPDVDFPTLDTSSLTEEKMGEWIHLATRLSHRTVEFREHYTSRWLCLREQIQSIGIGDAVRSRATRLSSALSQADSRARELSNWLGLPTPNDCGDVLAFGQLAQHFAESPGVVENWLDASDIQRLLMCAEEERERLARRNQMLQQLAGFLSEPLPSVDWAGLERAIDLSEESKEGCALILGSTWSRNLVERGVDTQNGIDEFLASCTNLWEAGRALTTELDQPASADVQEAWRPADLVVTLSVATDFISLEVVPASWFELPEAVLDAQVQELENLVTALVVAEEGLHATYSEGFVEAVDTEMLVRYRTDHRKFLRVLSGRYRKDQRLVRGFRRDAAKVDVSEATTGVESALRVKQLRLDVEQQSAHAAEIIGTRFLGRNTDWERVRADIGTLRSVLRKIDRTQAVCNLLVEGRAKSALVDRADTLSKALENLRARLRSLNTAADPEERTIESLRVAAETTKRCHEKCSQVLAQLETSLKAWPELLDSLWSIVRAGHEISTIDRNLLGRTDQLSADFGSRFNGVDTDWDEVVRSVDWSSQLLSLVQDYGTSGWRDHALEPTTPSSYLEAARELDELAASVLNTAAECEDVFDVHRTSFESWKEAPWLDLADWCRGLNDHADEAFDWLQYRQLVGGANDYADGLVEQIRAVTDEAGLIPQIVERRLLLRWLDAVIADVPELRGFAKHEHQTAIEEFRKLDRQSTSIAAREIQRRLLENYPKRGATLANAGQLGTLRDQLSRRRGQMPVRRLFQRIPQILQVLKPCSMMSPLAVSQYLPREAEGSIAFDTVIFDEASQVFPEDSVPSIVRARQVIVVGDEQQLPPTSFFRRAFDDDSDDAAEDDDQTDALSGRDSVLDAMNGMLGKGVTDRYLRVHYRSRHESLIRFSNHHFYSDRLIVFPSPATSRLGVGLSDCYVPDGRYDAGASRTNQREAERVVDMVFDIFGSKPVDESVGVVALSRAQADLIEFLIEQRRILHPEVEFRFSESEVEPFFVKNLENVQGDERDHMVMSIGYGPTVATGLVANRFGPLNAEGGHRRLNVAVTRARQSFTVVRSLNASDVRSEQLGPRLLRRYLEYLVDPVSAFEGEITGADAPPDSEFEQAVYEALTGRGHRVHRQVGVAKYRIDLGVLSEEGDRYDLGVECDGFTYHSSPAARDRDWLRQSILENLGWRIHRVWSTAWARNPMAEVAAIEAALEHARSAPVSRITGVSHEPATPLIVPLQTAPEAASPRPDLFDDYVQATLDEMRKGPQLQFETYPILLPLIQRIVEIEGPVHFETVMERLRVHYMMARARQATRDHIWRAVNRAEHEANISVTEGSTQADAFLATRDSTSAPPRRPASDSSRRAIAHISQVELISGLTTVARAAFGAERDELIRETARQFGYERTGEEISRRLGEAVDAALDERLLVEASGMLSATDVDE